MRRLLVLVLVLLAVPIAGLGVLFLIPSLVFHAEPDTPASRVAECAELVDYWRTSPAGTAAAHTFFAPRLNGLPPPDDLRVLARYGGPPSIVGRAALLVMIQRLDVEAKTPRSAVDCSTVFQGAGFALDPGADARTGLATGSPANGTTLIWFARPVEMGGWRLIRYGRIACYAGPAKLRQDVSPALGPHTYFQRRRGARWANVYDQHPTLLLMWKSIDRCPPAPS